jgi:hypothetical protein
MSTTQPRIVCSGCVHSKSFEYLYDNRGRLVYDASGQPVAVGDGVPMTTADAVGSVQEKHYYTVMDCTRFGSTSKLYFCKPACHDIYMRRRARLGGIEATLLDRGTIAAWKARSAALADRENQHRAATFGPAMPSELQ